MIIDTKGKIGVVLPGGGIKQIEASSAMLQCMLDHDIVPEYAYACSGGALTGAAYFSKVNFFDLFVATDANKLLSFNGLASIINGGGVYSTDGVEKLLSKIMGDRIFKNLVVNMTDIATHDVYYALGNKSTVIASMSIPKIFPSRVLNGTVFRLATPYEYNKPMACTHEIFFLRDRPVYDGGIYDLYPMPDYGSVAKSKFVFVLCCPTGESPEQMESGSNLTQSINWLLETMERGFRQMLSAFGGRTNVCILRPPPIDGPLLDWSDNFSVYKHSYAYMKNILKNLNKEKLT